MKKVFAGALRMILECNRDIAREQEPTGLVREQFALADA